MRYKTPLSCMMIDIDHFKAVNDTHGHAIGDAVIKDVAGSSNGASGTSIPPAGGEARSSSC